MNLSEPASVVMAQGTAAVIRVLADAEDAYTIRQIGRRAGISHARAAQVVALLDRHGVADPAVNAPFEPARTDSLHQQHTTAVRRHSGGGRVDLRRG